MTGGVLDLQSKIKNMLDEIPDCQPDDKRRAHTISKHDARWLANLMLLIVESGGCNLGLTADQAIALKDVSPDTLRKLGEMSPKTMESVKDMVKERRRILALVGVGFVTLFAYIGQKVLNALDGHFWKTLLLKMFG